MTGQTLECIGGPLDGKLVTLPEGMSTVQLFVAAGGLADPVHPPDAPVAVEAGCSRRTHRGEAWILHWEPAS